MRNKRRGFDLLVIKGKGLSHQIRSEQKVLYYKQVLVWEWVPAVILACGRQLITRNAVHVLQLHYENLIYNKKRRRNLCFPRPIQPIQSGATVPWRRSCNFWTRLKKKDAPEASWLLPCVAAFVTSDSIVYRTQGTMTCHLNGGGRGGGRGTGGGVWRKRKFHSAWFHALIWEIPC